MLEQTGPGISACPVWAIWMDWHQPYQKIKGWQTQLLTCRYRKASLQARTKPPAL